MFHDLATGTLRLPGCDMEMHLHDVETLNRAALDERFDITKLSFHAYLRVRNAYQLLQSGAAVGFGCGPIVVAARNINPGDLPRCRVAIPGELTTAHLLFRLWAPRADNKVFARYDRVMDLVADGRADAGVVIHEGRFLYERMGLQLLADLGQWWQEQTELPIPLGCIAARSDLGEDTIRRFDAVLREAIQNSLACPDATWAYVSKFASGMDRTVVRKHIETFVNAHTLDLGADGRRAVETLETMAREAGIIE